MNLISYTSIYGLLRIRTKLIAVAYLEIFPPVAEHEFVRHLSPKIKKNIVTTPTDGNSAPLPTSKEDRKHFTRGGPPAPSPAMPLVDHRFKVSHS